MKTMNKTKTFDCIKMKNNIQAKIYAETKDMTTPELLAYFNRQPENGLSEKRQRENDNTPGMSQGDAANVNSPLSPHP